MYIHNAYVYTYSQLQKLIKLSDTEFGMKTNDLEKHFYLLMFTMLLHCVLLWYIMSHYVIDFTVIKRFLTITLEGLFKTFPTFFTFIGCA